MVSMSSYHEESKPVHIKAISVFVIVTFLVTQFDIRLAFSMPQYSAVNPPIHQSNVDRDSKEKIHYSQDFEDLFQKYEIMEKQYDAEKRDEIPLKAVKEIDPIENKVGILETKEIDENKVRYEYENGAYFVVEKKGKRILEIGDYEDKDSNRMMTRRMKYRDDGFESYVEIDTQKEDSEKYEIYELDFKGRLMRLQERGVIHESQRQPEEIKNWNLGTVEYRNAENSEYQTIYEMDEEGRPERLLSYRTEQEGEVTEIECRYEGDRITLMDTESERFEMRRYANGRVGEMLAVGKMTFVEEDNDYAIESFIEMTTIERNSTEIPVYKFASQDAMSVIVRERLERGGIGKILIYRGYDQEGRYVNQEYEYESSESESSVLVYNYTDQEYMIFRVSGNFKTDKNGNLENPVEFVEGGIIANIQTRELKTTVVKQGSRFFVVDPEINKIETDQENVQSYVDQLIPARGPPAEERFRNVLDSRESIEEKIRTRKSPSHEPALFSETPETETFQYDALQARTFDYAYELLEQELPVAVLVDELTAEDLDKLLLLDVEIGILVLYGQIVLFTSGDGRELRLLQSVADLASSADFIAHTQPNGLGPSQVDLENAGEAIEYMVNQKGEVYAYTRNGVVNVADSPDRMLDAVSWAVETMEDAVAGEVIARAELNQFIAAMEQFEEAPESEKVLFRSDSEQLIQLPDQNETVVNTYTDQGEFVRQEVYEGLHENVEGIEPRLTIILLEAGRQLIMSHPDSRTSVIHLDSESRIREQDIYNFLTETVEGLTPDEHYEFDETGRRIAAEFVDDGRAIRQEYDWSVANHLTITTRLQGAANTYSRITYDAGMDEEFFTIDDVVTERFGTFHGTDEEGHLYTNIYNASGQLTQSRHFIAVIGTGGQPTGAYEEVVTSYDYTVGAGQVGITEEVVLANGNLAFRSRQVVEVGDDGVVSSGDRVIQYEAVEQNVRVRTDYLFNDENNEVMVSRQVVSDQGAVLETLSRQVISLGEDSVLSEDDLVLTTIQEEGGQVVRTDYAYDNVQTNRASVEKYASNWEGDALVFLSRNEIDMGADGRLNLASDAVQDDTIFATERMQEIVEGGIPTGEFERIRTEYAYDNANRVSVQQYVIEEGSIPEFRSSQVIDLGSNGVLDENDLVLATEEIIEGERILTTFEYYQNENAVEIERQKRDEDLGFLELISRERLDLGSDGRLSADDQRIWILQFEEIYGVDGNSTGEFGWIQTEYAYGIMGENTVSFTKNVVDGEGNPTRFLTAQTVFLGADGELDVLNDPTPDDVLLQMEGFDSNGNLFMQRQDVQGRILFTDAYEAVLAADGSSTGTFVRIQTTFSYSDSVTNQATITRQLAGDPAHASVERFDLGSDHRLNLAGEISDDRALYISFWNEDGEYVQGQYTYNADGSFSIAYVRNLGLANEVRFTEVYDAVGTLINVIQGVGPEDILEGVPQFFFDSEGRVIRRVDPNGMVTEFDPVSGLVTRVTQADGTYAAYDYLFNAANELQRTTLTYSTGEIEIYDPQGRLIESIDTEGMRQIFSYLGDNLSKIDSYDPEGLLLSTISYNYAADGSVTETVQDFVNRVDTINIYNAEGQFMSSTITNYVTKMTHHYDGLGTLLWSRNDETGYTVEYSGGLIQTVLDSTMQTLHEFSFVRNSDGQVVGASLNGANPLSYDASEGEYVEVMMAGGSSIFSTVLDRGENQKTLLLSNGVTINYDIAADGSIINIDAVTYPGFDVVYVTQEEGVVILQIVFQGNATFLRFEDNPADPGNLRLVSSQNVQGREDVYFYDADGNLSDLDYIAQGDGVRIYFRKDSEGTVLDDDDNPVIDRVLDRSGHVSIYGYTLAADPYFARTVTEYANEEDAALHGQVGAAPISVRVFLTEEEADNSVHEVEGGNFQVEAVVYVINQDQEIIARIEEGAVAGESLSLTYNNEGLGEDIASDFPASFWTAKQGELESKTYFAETIFEQKIIQRVEDRVTGLTTYYEYDPVGQGFLQVIRQYDPEGTADPERGDLLSESYFGKNEFLEPEIRYTVSYKGAGDGSGTREPDTLTIFTFLDDNTQIFSQYEIKGSLDQVIFADEEPPFTLVPAAGDEADTFISHTLQRSLGELGVLIITDVNIDGSEIDGVSERVLQKLLDDGDVVITTKVNADGSETAESARFRQHVIDENTVVITTEVTEDGEFVDGVSARFKQFVIDDKTTVITTEVQANGDDAADG
ncbi:MAG: RHS repeat protein, partial [Candidatus Omnitrophica bacterium]|nr:RHS repeat protein [Candidatus Omnitrophota bacterium]